MTAIAIGVHVHAEPARLLATLAALESCSPPEVELLLLPDGPDPATGAALARLGHIPQSPTDAPQGPAACFNRLARKTSAETVILIESGTIVSPGWLEKLLAALTADPRHGIASPSTNRAWNQLAVFPDARGDDAGIARTAAEADARFGEGWKSLAPLWDVGDFCLTVKRSVIDTVGPADEAYGLGPCWEMDYAVRAARAGFVAVWAQGAYVFRQPFTVRRQREEARLFEANRRRYQDKFCGLRLSGAKTAYSPHCLGEGCRHFAPSPVSGSTSPAPMEVLPAVPATAVASAEVTAALSPIEVAPSNPSAAIPASPAVITAADARAVPATAAPSPDAAEPMPRPAQITLPPDAPLVSCIMPTSGRPDWARRAIRYFQAQNYPNLELVIVDASADNALASLPDDPRVRRHRVSPRSSIGTMRNAACAIARGEIVVHWDDDDWYAPARVSAQVRPILDGTADITGLRDTRFFELDSWRFWRCSPELHARLFVGDVHGGTLAFRRSLHDANCRYPDVSLAEDAYFLRRAMARGARLVPIEGADLFIYLRHGRNAWDFPCGSYLDPRGWRPEAEPPVLAADRGFYAARSRAAAPLAVSLKPAMAAVARIPAPAATVRTPAPVAIGVHVHAEPHRLCATLTALEAHTPPECEILLLPDGPDPDIRAALAELPHLRQSATGMPLGPAACFNRLTQETTAEKVVLVESGTIVTPGWLGRLRTALAADPAHGIASPSTNRAWNRLAAFPRGRGRPEDLARTAEEAERRFGKTWRSLAPLWDVGDFCLAVTRAVIEAVGPADEGYGLGPCWEMDYAARAARAGFVSVWAPGAYVFRHPATARRRREEARHFEASRQRYQDKLCGLKLSGARAGYAESCRGEACEHFAPFGTRPAAPAIVRSRTPLVSCVMPTANRRRFMPGAIAGFLRGDYPDAELVILDDGDDAVGDLVPVDPRVRYLRAARHRSLGAKRNAACEAANGEIILHHDDDDWYAPDRVRLQVEALQRSGADVCGLDRVLFYDPRVPAAWEYLYPIGGVPWVAGATLCYRRDYWLRHPFPDLTIGEDNAFAAAARAGELHVMKDNRFFVALVHARNTSVKNVRDPRWRPRDVADVRALTGSSWPPEEPATPLFPGRAPRSIRDGTCDAWQTPDANHPLRV